MSNSIGLNSPSFLWVAAVQFRDRIKLVISVVFSVMELVTLTAYINIAVENGLLTLDQTYKFYWPVFKRSLGCY